MTERRWCDLSKKEKLALLCEAVPDAHRAAVAASVEKFFRGRPMPVHPADAINVVLRESWRAEHGDTSEWDDMAAAGGVVIR